MTFASAQLTAWAIPRLRAVTDAHVSAITPLSAGIISIERVGLPSFSAALLEMQKIGAADVDAVLVAAPAVQFISNVPRNSIIDGGAWVQAAARCVGLGRMGDLMRALHDPDVTTYQHPEIRFLERGLRQHSAILQFHRLDDIRYEIVRRGMPTLVVAMLNNYEVTADVIREAWEKFGQFDIAAATNPNARETLSSGRVASTLNVGVMKWGQLLGRLNSP